MKRLFSPCLMLAFSLSVRTAVAGGTWSVSASASDGAAQSLRAALQAADITPSSAASPNLIQLSPGTYVLTQGELAFGNSTNLCTQILGLGAPDNTIIRQTTAASRVFDINFYVVANVAASIQNVTITGGSGGVFGGGGILAGGPANSLLVSNCVIAGNVCTNALNGAGISWGGGGNLTLHSCVISNNAATNAAGGGVCFNNGIANSGSLLITNCQVFNNLAAGSVGAGLGGALYIAMDNTSSAAISQSGFVQNSAGLAGGALYAAGGASSSVNVQWCRIVSNTASAAPGVYNLCSTVSAANNWWGNNGGPGAAVGGSVATNVWLLLSHYASSSSALPNTATMLIASFQTNSAGVSIPAANLAAFAGTPVFFTAVSNGTISGAATNVSAAGYASAQFNLGSTSGAAAALATVDGVSALALVTVINGPAIPNPSFEANSFTVYPGYCSNNTLITGWTASATNLIGLNPAGSSPFANNGAVPNGNNVAFIQSTAGVTNYLATTVVGLTPGVRYAVACRINSRAGFATPTLLLGVNGGAPQPFVMPAVAASGNTTAAYGYAWAAFTATNSTASLKVASYTAADGALLVDNFTLAVLPSPLFSVSAWTGDASSGVSPTNIVRAYRFGSPTNISINGVTFIGVTNGAPAVSGSFALAGTTAVYNNTTNFLTALGGASSAELARNFVYGGNPATLSLYGLIAGQTYQLSVFGVAFDAVGNRNVLFAGAGDQLNVDEDMFGKGNGVRVDYTFVANATNTAITLTPAYTGATFHVHGFALAKTSAGAMPVVSIQPPVRSANTLCLSWNAVNLVPSVGYQVQYSTNLAGTNWLDLGSVVSGTNATFSVTNTIGADPQRFYRVRLAL
jgi:hypothetical protein